MSDPTALLNELERRGVELRADGDRLRYRPVDRVSEELLAQLRACKPELMTILRGRGDSDNTPDSSPLPEVLSPANANSSATADDPPPWANVRAARAKARRLGVLDLDFPANPAPVGARWLEGPALDRLPERLQGCVVAREGWTAPRWAEYLRHRAGICDDQHLDVAAVYRRAVSMLYRGNQNNG